MRKQKLFWFIFITSAIVSSFGIMGVVWYSVETVRNTHEERLSVQLKNEAELLFMLTHNDLSPDHLDSLLKEVSIRVGSRVTFIQEDGVVIGESQKSHTALENHKYRPEVQDALLKGVGHAIRWSHTVQQELIYIAVRKQLPTGAAVVVRTSSPVLTIDQVVMQNGQRIAKMALIILFVALLLSWFVSRYIAKKLQIIEVGARRMAEGNIEVPIPEMPWKELDSMGQSINHMAEQLDDRLKNVMRQRNEREAILSSMVEGVLALDKKQHIIRMNAVAESILGLSSATDVGKVFHELVNHTELLRTISRIKKDSSTIVLDLDFKFAQEHKIIEFRGSPILDSAGKRQGVLCILNDVTRMRQLEKMRQDFVANVSHELRTPITSIMGFVETIQDAPWEKPPAVDRFLGIIRRQTDRLQAIIEDMLELSRLERLERLDVRTQMIEPLLQSSWEVCKFKADNKQMQVHFDCAPDLQGDINANLFEQVVVNLVSNAIKYSDEEKQIFVKCYTDNQDFIFEIKDQGWGIPSRHISRIFERFYRIDKARSRDVGGTGLGLAIVKHIAMAHQAQIDVESEVGVGTQFRIRFFKKDTRTT
jgi:two-component system, OmpR family, phosphate regulon sensor histidine kinase PhoR